MAYRTETIAGTPVIPGAPRSGRHNSLVNVGLAFLIFTSGVAAYKAIDGAVDVSSQPRSLPTSYDGGMNGPKKDSIPIELMRSAIEKNIAVATQDNEIYAKFSNQIQLLSMNPSTEEGTISFERRLGASGSGLVDTRNMYVTSGVVVFVDDRVKVDSLDLNAQYFTILSGTRYDGDYGNVAVNGIEVGLWAEPVDELGRPVDPRNGLPVGEGEPPFFTKLSSIDLNLPSIF